MVLSWASFQFDSLSCKEVYYWSERVRTSTKAKKQGKAAATFTQSIRLQNINMNNKESKQRLKTKQQKLWVCSAEAVLTARGEKIVDEVCRKADPP